MVGVGDNLYARILDSNASDPCFIGGKLGKVCIPWLQDDDD